MSDYGKPLNVPIITGRPGAVSPSKPKQTQTAPQGATFEQLLQKTYAQTRTQQITFSRHAQARTAQRGIELSDADLDRLSDAVGKAGEKGVTDTLVFMNNTAFIVNVPSRVVVTVVGGDGSEQNVFTNIDGAVIVE